MKVNCVVHIWLQHCVTSQMNEVYKMKLNVCLRMVRMWKLFLFSIN